MKIFIVLAILEDEEIEIPIAAFRSEEEAENWINAVPENGTLVDFDLLEGDESDILPSLIIH